MRFQERLHRQKNYPYKEGWVSRQCVFIGWKFRIP